LPDDFSISAGSCLRCRKSSYARRATCFSTTSASIHCPSVSIANRLTAAPAGNVIANVPSRIRFSVFAK
jgi:hypothetical protein